MIPIVKAFNVTDAEDRNWIAIDRSLVFGIWQTVQENSGKARL
jgi:hypothetical protein